MACREFEPQFKMLIGLKCKTENQPIPTVLHSYEQKNFAITCICSYFWCFACFVNTDIFFRTRFRGKFLGLFLLGYPWQRYTVCSHISLTAFQVKPFERKREQTERKMNVRMKSL
jgi:hypothetical protein